MDQERFDIVKIIGKGRTGGVYEAIDTLMNQRVALRRFFSVTGDTDVSSWQDSFIALAQNLAQVQHPALMAIYASGVDEDGAFMSTELLEGGRSLEDIIDKNGHLSDENFYVMANNLLDAFSVMHFQGFCHGSLSGRSVMEVPLATGGKVYKCVDLGMSSMIPMINPAMPMLACGDPALTAPELFEGTQPDARSDVYMLGHLFYLSLAGGHPLAGIPAEDAHRKHKGHKFAPLSGYRSSVPKDIVEWIEKLTQADPAERPQSAGEALRLMPVHDFSQKPPNAITSRTPERSSAAPVGPARTFGAAYGVKNTLTSGVKIPQKQSNAGLILGLIGGAVVLLLVIAIAATSSGSKGNGSTGENREETSSRQIAKPNNEKNTNFSEGNLTVKEPSESELKEMQRISYFPQVSVISKEDLDARKGIEKVLDLTEAEAAWYVGENGSGISIGTASISLDKIHGNWLKRMPWLGIKYATGANTLDFGHELRVDGASPKVPFRLRFSVKNLPEGDMKVRLYARSINLNLSSSLAIKHKLNENRLVKDWGSMEGLVAMDFEIRETTGSEIFAFDYIVKGRKNSASFGSFAPIALMIYSGDKFPSVLEDKKEAKPINEDTNVTVEGNQNGLNESVTETKPKKKPVEKDNGFKNGVKVTPNPDGTNTIELEPLGKEK